LAEDPFPQTAECGRCGSEPLRDLVVILGGARDGNEVPELLRVNVTMPNESSIWRGSLSLGVGVEAGLVSGDRLSERPVSG
jgi:hypothetical protein